MKPLSFLMALMFIVTITAPSIGENKDGSKKVKRQEFLIILEQGAIKFLTAKDTTKKNSQPVTDDAMKISCEKVQLNGHIDKNGKYQLQVQMTGNVQITGKDMQAKANSVLLNVKTNRLQIQSTGNDKVTVWWKRKDGGRSRIEAKQMEFDLSSNNIDISGATKMSGDFIKAVLSTGGP